MARRKIEDEGEARRCVAAMEAAGGDLRAWALMHGVDGRSLHAWRVNLARAGDSEFGARLSPRNSETPSGLVELVPRTRARNATPVPTGASRYVVDVGVARIEFGDDFSEPTLRRVLGVLRSC